VLLQVGLDRGLEFGHAVEDAASDGLVGDQAEEPQAPSSLSRPLHPDLGLVDQSGRATRFAPFGLPLKRVTLLLVG